MTTLILVLAVWAALGPLLALLVAVFLPSRYAVTWPRLTAAAMTLLDGPWVVLRIWR